MEVDTTEQEAIRRVKKLFKLYVKDEPHSEHCLYADAVKMSEEALEKQIAKVPCYSGDDYYDGQLVLDTWECPCCGDKYEVFYDDYDYCPKCGQHIDHSTLT